MQVPPDSPSPLDLLATTDPFRSAALILWDYHQLRHSLRPAEGIIVFGSYDLRVAAHAADLFHADMAPWLLFSGAQGRMTEHWAQAEAEAMAEVAIQGGVPADHVFIESRATNTGENIRFTRELLAAKHLHPSQLIAVQKPYMERRTFAALEVQWPEVSFLMSSPPLDFDAYCSGDIKTSEVISAIVGDFQRIIDYPSRGFASVQVIPPHVEAAFETLVAAGFTEHMLD